MSNRDRLIVALGEPWFIYQISQPIGWDMLGTVQRGHEIGALARHQKTGNLVMMRAGAVSMLDQRKAAAAIESADGKHDPR